MTKQKLNTILTIMIALVWLVNGLLCKVLNMTPRHNEIVSQILNKDHSQIIINIIGVLEILMALWVLSKLYSRLNTIMQMIIIFTMNIVEFIYVPDLLLWGRFNLIFAFIFILILCTKEFKLNLKLKEV